MGGCGFLRTPCAGRPLGVELLDDSSEAVDFDAARRDRAGARGFAERIGDVVMVPVSEADPFVFQGKLPTFRDRPIGFARGDFESLGSREVVRRPTRGGPDFN